jgi:CheY-like chemotaxis protein
MSLSVLAGRRVLVVEDEILVAMLIEDMLGIVGCTIVGPCDNVDDALAAARQEAMDMAVLDVNLAGRKVFPVAEVLAERGIPFLLLTGYGESALPRNRHWPVCDKPFTLQQLMSALKELIAGA